MGRGSHTEAPMEGAIRQVEAGPKAEDVAREVSVSKAQDTKRLRDESSRLKKLVADLSLDKDALQVAD